WILGCKLAHRLLVSDIERGQISFRIVGITNRKRINVTFFRLRSVFLQGKRALHCFVASLLPLGINGKIVIRPKGKGDAPPRHRELRVEFRSALERTTRFVMIETENQLQSLIEELLGLVILRRNRVMRITQSRNQDRRALLLFRGVHPRDRTRHQSAQANCSGKSIDIHGGNGPPGCGQSQFARLKQIASYAASSQESGWCPNLKSKGLRSSGIPKQNGPMHGHIQKATKRDWR